MTAAAQATEPRGRIPAWTFADRLRKIRTDILDLHQAEFAELLGVTKAAYAAWESGRNEPRSILALAKKVELISRVPAAWVLGVDSPNLDTAVDTRRYPTDISGLAPVIPLLSGPARRYAAVPAGYGSSATGRRVDDESVDGCSPGGVNNAHAA